MTTRNTLIALVSLCLSNAVHTAPIYLNDDAGISVSLNSGALSGGGLSNIINADSASELNLHTQSTHAYISGNGAQMDLRFDLGADYDLQTAHLWNIDETIFPTWGVTAMHIEFLADDLTILGSYESPPITSGGNGDPFAEDFDLGGVLGVRFVDVLLTGSTSGVDITNFGFTATVSGDSNLIDLTDEVGGVGFGTDGDDTFIVDDEFDQIIDAGEGVDTVKASISFELGDDLENLTLLGEEPIDATGNELDNVLEGNVNDNVLNGAGGADTMRGDSGNDRYFVDNENDGVIETENNTILQTIDVGVRRQQPTENDSDGSSVHDIGDDVDEVVATISYALTDFVENLTLDGFADVDGIGNELNNVIVGNSGDNVLTTGQGDEDTLSGGDGVDTFIINKVTGSTVVTDTPGEADTLDLREFLGGSDPSTLMVSSVEASLLIQNASAGSIEVEDFFPLEGRKSVEYLELGEGPVDFSGADDADAVRRLLGGAVNEFVDDDNNYWNASIRTAGGNMISAAEAQLYRTYSGALGRTPDQGGYDWWLNEINEGTRDLNQMAADFIWSQEFLGFFGAPDGNSIDNAEFVNHMYRTVFGREPDQGGFDFWFGELESGRRTQARVLVDMTQSNEYVEQTLNDVVDFRGS